VDALENKPAGALTGRQREVLNLIVQGRSNKEIARILKLGEGTVKVHVAALFSKLGINRRSAVAVAGARFMSEAAKEPDSDSRPGVERMSSERVVLLSRLTHPSRFPGLGYTSRFWPRTRPGG
jgi:DNA-binding CsgD family transcriptional regulator